MTTKILPLKDWPEDLQNETIPIPNLMIALATALADGHKHVAFIANATMRDLGDSGETYPELTITAEVS